MKANEKIYDVLIVGSGPGGSVTGALLAEAGLQVAMIEAALPQAPVTEFSIDEMRTRYHRGGMTLSLGRPKILYVEGSSLGGGSEVNAGLYHRTPNKVLEQWQKDFNLRDASPERMKPFFELNEKDLGLEVLETDTEVAEKMIQGANRLGWESLRVPRWYKNGIKQSMSRTFLPRFLAAGGFLRTGSRLLQFKKKQGVFECYVKSSEGTSTLMARQLFLGTGAVTTPTILRRHGFKRNVGASMGMHPSLKILAQFKEPINHATDHVGSVQIKEFSPNFSFGCSISRPAHLAMQLLNLKEDLRYLDQTFKSMGMYYAMTSPSSGARLIHLPFGLEPLIFYQLNKSELEQLGKAAERLGELLFAAGASRLKLGSSRSEWDESLESFYRRIRTTPTATWNLMTIHLFGSCPMGENRSLCAVDSFGRLHEDPDIHVCDASLLCGSPTVNPQGSLMAFARRNAEHFLRSWKNEGGFSA